MGDSMYSKDFILKLRYEGGVESYYFGRNVKIEGPGSEALMEAWHKAFDAVNNLDNLIDQIADENNWDIEV